MSTTSLISGRRSSIANQQRIFSKDEQLGCYTFVEYVGNDQSKWIRVRCKCGHVKPIRRAHAFELESAQCCKHCPKEAAA